jgi:hypothetical protein
MPRSARRLTPRITDPLRVLLIPVQRSERKSATHPAIKKILRDVVPFRRLATQLVAAVRPTMVMSTLLNS